MKYFYVITRLSDNAEFFGYRPIELIDKTSCYLIGLDYGISFQCSKIRMINDYLFEVNGTKYSYHLVASVNHLNECYYCEHKRDISNSVYLYCSKPNPSLKYDQYGKINGWFYYPLSFDPIWKTSNCKNCKLNKFEITKPW